MKNKKYFGYLVWVSALLLSICSGYYSITGLAQLFSGKAKSVILMSSFLELAKIITTIVLHKYWGGLTKSLKIYLTSGVAILMIITSLGVYGMLSSGYVSNKNKFQIHNEQVNILNNKKEIFNKSIIGNQEIIENKNKRIALLTNLRNNQETRLDSAKTNRSKDKVRKDIQEANNEITKLTNDIDDLTNKNSILNDSIGKYEIKILETNSKSEISNEIGSLKYISDISGLPMDNIVNYFILLIIFVFDPLALSLIIAANKILELDKINIKDIVDDSDLISDNESLEDINFNNIGNNKKHLKFKIPISELKKEDYFIPEKNSPLLPSLNTQQEEELIKKINEETNNFVFIDLNQTNSETESDKNIEFAPNQDNIIFEEQLENKNEEEILPNTSISESILEEPKEEIIEQTKEDKQINKITINDIKEKKEEFKRGFSVDVPKPKHKVGRIS